MSKFNDPMLQKVADGIDAKVPKELQQAYLQVVVSGMKVMFDPRTTKMMQQALSASPDMVKNVSTGIASLLVILYKESNKQMSVPAAMLAAIVLMCHALDYAEQTMGLKITPDLIAQCTHATQMAALAKFGIGQQQINQVVAAHQGVHNIAGAAPAQTPQAMPTQQGA